MLLAGTWAIGARDQLLQHQRGGAVACTGGNSIR